MKMVALVFLFLTYTTFKTMVINDQNPEAIVFPTLNLPEFEFNDPGNCSNFFDCTEFLAKVIFNIGKAFVLLIQSLFELGKYLALIFVLLAKVSISGFEGAANWINVIINAVFVTMVGIKLYTMSRVGTDEE